MERVKRKKSKMPCIFGGIEESPKRKTVQPRSPSDGSIEQDLFKFEAGLSSSKQCTGTPMKKLLAKEMSNETLTKKRSPSIIAKLMGLDGLPSPQPIHRQQRRFSDNSDNSTTSLRGQRNEKPFNHRSEQQQFKDVFEDPEASHVTNQLHLSQSTAKRKLTKKELAFIREQCKEVKRSNLEMAESSSDLTLNYLQPQDSIFVKHLHDQQDTPSRCLCEHITVLKPSYSVKHASYRKGWKEEETKTYNDLVSHKRHEDRLSGYSSHSTSYSHKPSRVQLEMREVIDISPTKIVVLKPHIAKIYNAKSSIPSPDAHRTREEGSWMYRESPGEIRSSRHKSREARQIAREITNRMKEGFRSGHFNSIENGSKGNLGDKILMTEPSRNSFDLNDIGKHSPFNMCETSVVREAKKRMSERWTMTHGYKDEGMVSKGSTLGEMLSVPVRNSSRSRSLPPSFHNQNHRMSIYPEAHVEEKVVIYSEPLNRGSSKGMKRDFNLGEESLSKNLRCARRGRSCSTESANFLPETRYSQKLVETYSENEDLDEQPLVSDVHNGATNDVSVVDSEISYGIETCSVYPNELIPGFRTCMLGDANSTAVDDYSSYSQEPSTRGSGGIVSIQLSGPEPESSESSKEIDSCSLLEVPPTEDVSSGSDCFESVNSQLHELRKQLQLLKMESGSTNEDLTSIPINEAVESEPFIWESMYLTDVLRVSGFYDSDPYTWQTLDYNYPIDPHLFDHLEKEYSDDKTVSRSERRLLYDRIIEALFVISKSMVSCSWVNPENRGIQMTLLQLGFEDQVHKLLAKQEKEVTEDFQEIFVDKDLEWFRPVHELDIVGKQISDLLVNDLVLEVLTV